MDPDREIIVFCLVCIVILGLIISTVCACISISRKRNKALHTNQQIYNNRNTMLANYNNKIMNNQPSSYMNWYTSDMAVSQNPWPKYEINRNNYMTDENMLYNNNHMDNDCLNAALLPHGQSFVYP